MNIKNSYLTNLNNLLFISSANNYLKIYWEKNYWKKLIFLEGLNTIWLILSLILYPPNLNMITWKKKVLLIWLKEKKLLLHILVLKKFLKNLNIWNMNKIHQSKFHLKIEIKYLKWLLTTNKYKKNGDNIIIKLKDMLYINLNLLRANVLILKKMIYM